MEADLKNAGNPWKIIGNLWKPHDFDGELYGVTTKDGELFWTIVFLIPGGKMLVDKEVRQAKHTHSQSQWGRGQGQMKKKDIKLISVSAEIVLNS